MGETEPSNHAEFESRIIQEDKFRLQAGGAADRFFCSPRGMLAFIKRNRVRKAVIE